jgi:hypothetical protein
MIVHRISAVSLVALKSENLSMAGTGSYSYYILCIEYTLHYTVASLGGAGLPGVGSLANFGGPKRG